MPWLGILKLFLTLTDNLVSFMHDKQLMDAGEAKAVSGLLKGAMDATQKAMAARNAVRDDAGSITSDPDNRDRPS